MTKPNNGGPAFAHGGSDLDAPQEGMTLRDYFAGQALAGSFATALDHGDSPSNVATAAYLMADAILREREA